MLLKIKLLSIAIPEMMLEPLEFVYGRRLEKFEGGG
jgi:hypothetical protein